LESEEIEWQELRAITLDEHWRELNAIVHFAPESGMEKGYDDSEKQLYLR
jgi:hypothetical protein